MKKTIITSSIIATSFLISQFTTMSAFAADLSSTYNSNASITFEPNTDPTNPVDPTNPDDPFNPDNPAQPGTDGPLSIDYASNLNFGTQKITTQDQYYYADLTKGTNKNGDTLEVPNYVQVTDNTGSNKGWKLQVTQTKDFTNTETNSTLKGAELALYETTLATLSNSDSGVPTREAQIQPQTGVTVLAATAEQNQGQGTWTLRFGRDNEQAAKSVYLFVPGASTKDVGTYSTTLKWDLAQTPTETID